MIIKVLSRKSNTGALMSYLFKYLNDEEKVSSKPFVLRHNVRSNSINAYTKEFEANEANRLHKRKNQPRVYHTILSWHKDDAHCLDDKKLRVLVKAFIQQRGRLNKYVASKHTDRDHIHVHVAISATNILGKSSRISKQEFEQLKIDMDRFQKEKFPELEHSLPKHGRKRAEQKMYAIMQKELHQLEQLRNNSDKEIEQGFERVREFSFGY